MNTEGGCFSYLLDGGFMQGTTPIAQKTSEIQDIAEYLMANKAKQFGRLGKSHPTING